MDHFRKLLRGYKVKRDFEFPTENKNPKAKQNYL